MRETAGEVSSSGLVASSDWVPMARLGEVLPAVSQRATGGQLRIRSLRAEGMNDFDTVIERSDVGINRYAGVLARMSHIEDLLHFSAGGVAALAEHGARIAARKGKITARFGRLADVVREASFIARKDDAELVERRHVEDTVRRTKYRASLPTQRFMELISDGTIHVATQGKVVGQINGLAVMHAGPLSYGFPARITATIGAGRAGVIDIEGAAAMSGSIHTKGFHILGGLLRQRR